MAETPDPVAAELAAIRERADAAARGPWELFENHGIDHADEGWSKVYVTGEFGQPVAVAYETGLLEPDDATENAAFIVAARSDVPRLLAAVEAVLRLTQRDDGNDRHPDRLLRVGEVREAISRDLLSEEGSGHG